jgi:hypothetical protein
LRAAVIAPIGLLKRYAARSKYHLCLAHLCQDLNPYSEFYRDAVARGEYVILDNSIIELRRPMTETQLYTAINIIRPTEFVCQDFPRDPPTTHFWAMHKAPELKKRYPNMKLMVVPQWNESRLLGDWWASFLWLKELPFIDTIGLPKFIREGRYYVTQDIDKDPALYRDKEFHLLGTWGNPLEVKDMAQYEWIRGVDSKAPVRFGQSGVTLHPERGLLADFRDEIPALDFNSADDPMPVITDHNVRTYLTWARGEQDAKVLRFPKEPEEGFETKSRLFKGP